VAVKEGFQVNLTFIGAKATDGHLIMVYGKHIVKIEITNSFSEYRVSDVEFIITDIK
jgi:hypothetical protein